MFKKSSSEQQHNLYTSASQYLNDTCCAKYNDQHSWQNVFYEQVTSKIDEKLFSCLFSKGIGAPNSPIRVLIAMMLLKEGNGWSDNDLFENCRFNLLVRKSLGLVNIDDPIPSESTYYMLRRRICSHKEETGKDLFDELFKAITKSQVVEFDVSGKSIRLDSKLIGSNIAAYNRYEIIHKSLCLYVKKNSNTLKDSLKDDEFEILSRIVNKDSSKTSFYCTKDEITQHQHQAGEYIFKVLSLSLNTESSEYKTLKRVFEEQFSIKDDNPELRNKEEISAKSTQSPHDTDCHYRKKNDTSTKGYSHNVTETCNEEGLNLITDIQVLPATAPDNEFVIPAIENTIELVGNTIENIHTDGAYNSTDNQDYANNNKLSFYPTGMQGAPGRYDLSQIESNSVVIDRETGEKLQCTKTPKGNYRITNHKNKYRYFTAQEIKNQHLRKYLESLPQEIKNVRNNVEATIFQFAYPLRKDKTKYRGLYKNQIWAILRCLWVNCTRIIQNITKLCQRTNCNLSYSLLIYRIKLFILSIFSLTPLESREVCWFGKSGF